MYPSKRTNAMCLCVFLFRFEMYQTFLLCWELKSMWLKFSMETHVIKCVHYLFISFWTLTKLIETMFHKWFKSSLNGAEKKEQLSYLNSSLLKLNLSEKYLYEWFDQSAAVHIMVFICVNFVCYHISVCIYIYIYFHFFIYFLRKS